MSTFSKQFNFSWLWQFFMNFPDFFIRIFSSVFSMNFLLSRRNGLPRDSPGFDSRWERYIYRASRPSQGTVNGGAVLWMTSLSMGHKTQTNKTCFPSEWPACIYVHFRFEINGRSDLSAVLLRALSSWLTRSSACCFMFSESVACFRSFSFSKIELVWARAPIHTQK